MFAYSKNPIYNFRLTSPTYDFNSLVIKSFNIAVMPGTRDRNIIRYFPLFSADIHTEAEIQGKKVSLNRKASSPLLK